MWDKEKEKLGKHDKFDCLWLCPYGMEGFIGSNSFFLSHLDGEKLELNLDAILC